MVNAWSLLDSVLKGTLDEDFPIMNKGDKDVTVLGGEENKDKDIDIDLSGIGTVVDWGDDGFSVTGNPTASPDTINFSAGDALNFGAAESVTIGSGLLGGMGNDHIDFSGIAGTQYDDPKYFASSTSINFDGCCADGVDPVYAYHYPGTETTKPQPDLTSQATQKYREDKGIADLKDYVSSTYSGHYTSKNNNVQTLDLIQSVGDAESFCRSNAIKYLSRYDKKGQAKRDILKAMHYCLLLYYFSGQTNDEITTHGYETF